VVERTATDNGEEESLEPPRRTYEIEPVCDVGPSSDPRPPAEATPHIETNTAPDDDEPQPRGLTASAVSERADHSDADVSPRRDSLRPSVDIRERWRSPRRRILVPVSRVRLPPFGGSTGGLRAVMQELLRIPSSTVSRAATLRNSVVTSGSPRGTVIELILPSGSIAAPWGRPPSSRWLARRVARAYVLWVRCADAQPADRRRGRCPPSSATTT